MRTLTVPQKIDADNYDEFDDTARVCYWITKDNILRKTARIIAEFGGIDALIQWVCECFIPELGDSLANDLAVHAVDHVNFRQVHDYLMS